GVAREREILLSYVRRRPPDFHLRSVGLEASRKRILALAIVVVATAAATILLSLPHCLIGSHLTCIQSHDTRPFPQTWPDKHSCPSARTGLGRIGGEHSTHGPNIATTPNRTA